MIFFSPYKVRKDFPILQKGITYFDNACMPLKPVQVIEALNLYYKDFPGCAGRSQHSIGKKVGEEVERARNIIKKFFNVDKDGEIIFTKNCTEAINLVARGFKFNCDDKVLGTDKEHNSNLIPWLNHPAVKHLTLFSLPDETFDIEKYKEMVKGVKLVSMVHTSNLDGTTIPAKEIIKIAHENGALVLLDCAQSAAHSKLDFKKLDVDFVACSGHKMLSPTGIGFLYGKKELLNQMNPFIVGGETVKNSTYDSFEFDSLPHKFEAGLQHYAGIIGFGAAIKYLDKVGMNNVHNHEIKLNKILTEGLKDVVEIIGPKDAFLRSGIFSFNVLGKDVHEVAILLDSAHDIMVRSGAHCVHSWFNAHKMQGSVRASLYFYNTEGECNKFVEAVKEIVKF